MSGLAISGAMIVGCQATQVKPEANRIIVTRQPAPKGCKFLGSAIGEQGGSFTGGWTSNKALAQGALNDMKNKAYEMGGNYVVLEESKAGNTMSGSAWSMSAQQTDVTNQGNVYHCPEDAVGL